MRDYDREWFTLKGRKIEALVAECGKDPSADVWVIFQRVIGMACEEKEHPDITVVRKVAVGTPRSVLLTAAARSQMLIAGCRGRGGFEGMNLGSVAQAVLHYSPCPVGIVHPQGYRPGQGWNNAMDGGSTISADAVVALARAIDAATDRGDSDEAARLASLRGAELNRWLEAHGYPWLREDEPGSRVK